MDEGTLRELLAHASAEPPVGPMAGKALAAGIRLRRRRRIQATAACAGVIVVACVAVPVLTRASARPPAPVQGLRPPTAYIANSNSNTLTPISTATNKAGKPIWVGENPFEIAMMP